MTHTPAPWRYYRNPRTDAFIMAAGDEAKGQARIVFLCPDEQKAPTEENARLIAAAPEMLEACKMAVVLLQESGRPHTRDEERTYCSVVGVLGQAIATAEEGRQ